MGRGMRLVEGWVTREDEGLFEGGGGLGLGGPVDGAEGGTWDVDDPSTMSTTIDDGGVLERR